MTALSAFLPEIRPTLPSVTLMALLRAARKTTRIFCRETKAYEFDFTSADYTLSVNNTLATFTLPAGSEIFNPLVVQHGGGHCLFSGTKDAKFNSKGSLTCQVIPPDVLRFNTGVSAALTGTFVLMPTYDSLEIPDALFARHYEVLCEGILANLYLMENTTWFNPDLAQLHASFFMSGVEKITEEVAGRSAYHGSVTSYGGL